jgi:hypothetical protein
MLMADKVLFDAENAENARRQIVRGIRIARKLAADRGLPRNVLNAGHLDRTADQIGVI